jgi:hypothetical protein
VMARTSRKCSLCCSCAGSEASARHTSETARSACL